MSKQIIFSALLIVFFFSISFVSCDKKMGKSPLTESPTISTTTTTTGPPTVVSECDTITYNKHIKLIMNQNCGSNPQCHTSGISLSGLELDTYDQVKSCANSNKLKLAIFNAQPQQMPPDGSPQLSDDQKRLINCWLNKGLKN